VTGLMMESFLVEGNQSLGGDLVYGRSVTDECLSWDTTADLLSSLAAAAHSRRTA
jgi:3-deoxy-7-phosphoheptulonate synthase